MDSQRWSTLPAHCNQYAFEAYREMVTARFKSVAFGIGKVSYARCRQL
jgi:hypothetical protein